MAGPYGSGEFGTIPFSTTPFYQTKELIDAVLRATNHSDPSVETVRRRVVLDALNNRYSYVTTMRHWDWLYAALDIPIEAPYETGTLAATQGSEILTGTGTLWSTNAVFTNKIIIQDTINTIIKANSNTVIELEGEFAGDTAAAYNYKIVKPVLELPADCEHVRSFSIDTIGELVPLGTQEFRRKQQYSPTEIGPPRWFTETFRRPQDGIRLVELWPNPDKKYNGHIDYGVQVVKLADEDDNFPLLPDRYRVVLYYGALAEFYRFLRDPVNADKVEQAFTIAMIRMQNDTQITDSRLILQPAKNYRTRGRRYRIAMDRSDFSRDG